MLPAVTEAAIGIEEAEAWSVKIWIRRVVAWIRIKIRRWCSVGSGAIGSICPAWSRLRRPLVEILLRSRVECLVSTFHGDWRDQSECECRLWIYFRRTPASEKHTDGGCDHAGCRAHTRADATVDCSADRGASCNSSANAHRVASIRSLAAPLHQGGFHLHLAAVRQTDLGQF